MIKSIILVAVGLAVLMSPAEARRHAYNHSTAHSDGCRSGVAALSCLKSTELQTKAREIVAACGSTVVSVVAPRGHRSNHPEGRAVDLVGNPACIYAHLHGWPGGYSTDYARVHHVHISYNPGGQEWGLHFAHGGRSATRLASRHQGLQQHASLMPVVDRHALH